MATHSQIWQVARLLGQDEFLNCLSLASLEQVRGLDEAQLAKVRQCTLENARRVTRALVHEAASRNDISSAAQAAAFLEERLAALGDLLTPEARADIRAGYRSLTSGWGDSAAS